MPPRNADIHKPLIDLTAVDDKTVVALWEVYYAALDVMNGGTADEWDRLETALDAVDVP